MGRGPPKGSTHLFEGWVPFMASLGLLILEMLVLASIGVAGGSIVPFSLDSPGPTVHLQPTSVPLSGLQPLRSPLASTLAFSSPQPPSSPSSRLHAPLTSHRFFLGPAYLCSVALLVPVAFASTLMVEREEVQPPRAMFIDFPMKLDGWLGTSLTLEKQYIDTLRFDDYVLADYRFGDGQSVNLYARLLSVTTRGSRRTPLKAVFQAVVGKSPHLIVWTCRRAREWFGRCMNRALIQRDSQKQIVLYWFKQRDRILSNEYLVKFYLFWDALSRGRTDGALVRNRARSLAHGETEDIVDQRLLRFVSTIEPEIDSIMLPD